MKRSNGFIVALIAWYLFCALAALGIWAGIIWAAVHFIRKFW